MGGLLILFAATVAFLPVNHFRAPGAHRPLHRARVRGDRLPRRLHQAARTSGRSVCSAAGSSLLLAGVTVVVGDRRAPPAPEHRRLHPGRSTSPCRCRTLVRVPLLRDRRGGERHEPRRRRRRAPRGHGDHRPLHVHGDERRLVRPLRPGGATQPDEARPRHRRRGADRGGDRLPLVQRLPGGGASWATPARWRSAARSRRSRS